MKLHALLIVDVFAFDFFLNFVGIDGRRAVFELVEDKSLITIIADIVHIYENVKISNRKIRIFY